MMFNGIGGPLSAIYAKKAQAAEAALAKYWQSMQNTPLADTHLIQHRQMRGIITVEQKTRVPPTCKPQRK